MRQFALEHRLLLRDEGLVGAVEVLRLHADRLRLRLGLDRLVDAHVPFLVQHASWSCRGRRSGRRRARRAQSHGRRQQRLRRDEAVEEAPGSAPRRPASRGRCRAAPTARPWPMMRGRMLQAPMSQPARPTRVNRKAALLRAVPTRRSEAIAMIAPAPAHTPSIAAIDRLRAGAHRLDQVARHAREGQQVRHAHLRQRADDLVHVAARAEVAAGAAARPRRARRRRRPACGTGRAARRRSRRSAGSCARAGSA